MQRTSQLLIPTEVEPRNTLVILAGIWLLLVLFVTASPLRAQEDDLRPSVTPIDINQESAKVASTAVDTSAPIAIAVTKFELSTLPLDAFADAE